MRRPVIGITTYAQEASWGVWRLPAALIPLNYVEAVERAGGRPVLIPPSEDGVAETIEALDGIVFSGGADVDPAHAGRGIGTAMYAFALARMKEAGIRVATVATGGDASHAPARRAYAKAGFSAEIPSVWMCRTL